MAKIILLTLLSISILISDSLVLVSDLPTPSFLLDVSAIQRFMNPLHDKGDTHLYAEKTQKIPAIVLPDAGAILYPEVDGATDFDAPQCENLFRDNDVIAVESGEVFAYLHASVVLGRTDYSTEGRRTNFLTELDLPPSLCYSKDLPQSAEMAERHDIAKPCLGLNNHHVGGYYWARAAGSGSAMEAPGVRFVDNGNDVGVLEWENEEGAFKSNTNDGKRSEWVNFLRNGDQIQLIPTSAEGSLLAFVKQFDDEDSNDTRVYGFSNEGRPLGSDPVVVCSFRC